MHGTFVNFNIKVDCWGYFPSTIVEGANVTQKIARPLGGPKVIFQLLFLGELRAEIQLH